MRGIAIDVRIFNVTVLDTIVLTMAGFVTLLVWHGLAWLGPIWLVLLVLYLRYKVLSRPAGLGDIRIIRHEEVINDEHEQ